MVIRRKKIFIFVVLRLLKINHIVRNIANWLNRNVGLIRSDLVALIDELGTRIFEEMDYLKEASNA